MYHADKDAEDQQRKDQWNNIEIGTGIHNITSALLADVFMLVTDAWSTANPLLPLPIALPTVSLTKGKSAPAI